MHTSSPVVLDLDRDGFHVIYGAPTTGKTTLKSRIDALPITSNVVVVDTDEPAALWTAFGDMFPVDLWPYARLDADTPSEVKVLVSKRMAHLAHEVKSGALADTTVVVVTNLTHVLAHVRENILIATTRSPEDMLTLFTARGNLLEIGATEEAATRRIRAWCDDIVHTFEKANVPLVTLATADVFLADHIRVIHGAANDDSRK